MGCRIRIRIRIRDSLRRRRRRGGRRMYTVPTRIFTIGSCVVPPSLVLDPEELGLCVVPTAVRMLTCVIIIV